MTSRYPAGLDEFRDFLDGFDDMVAQDLNDLFDSILAVENELGIEPSGDLGTIFGRIFGRGTFSQSTGGWVPVQCAVYENRDAATFFDEDLAADTSVSRRFELDDSRWFGDLGWEEDTPTVFAGGTVGLLQYAGIPWGQVIVEVGPAHFLVVGRDAAGNQIDSGNTATLPRFGVIGWAVDVGGSD